MVQNKDKILWDVKKALHAIHSQGYMYSNISWDKICIHNNNFKLLVDDTLKNCSSSSIEYNEQYDSCWVSFIILFNSAILTQLARISANHERQQLNQLLLTIQPHVCIVHTLRMIENTYIYHISGSEELQFLMNNLGGSDDEELMS